MTKHTTTLDYGHGFTYDYQLLHSCELGDMHGWVQHDPDIGSLYPGDIVNIKIGASVFSGIVDRFAPEGADSITVTLDGWDSLLPGVSLLASFDLPEIITASFDRGETVTITVARANVRFDPEQVS
jgi:hypothetical protein